MKKEQKLEKNLNDKDYIEKLKSNYLSDLKVLSFEFTHHDEPENYVRERYTGRGHRFYNAKEKIMKDLKQELLKQVPFKDKEYLQQLFNNEDAIYYVYLDINFFVKIPKADSVDTIILKENRIILPAIAPDLDNYIKLLIDSLHDVIFEDDKRVISINSNKFYSLKPRTELKVRLEIVKD